MKNIRYVLLSALMGAVLWFVITEIEHRVYAYTYWGLTREVIAWIHAIIVIIGVIPGTYVGLWSIGRVRKPSVAYGVLVGLVSFTLILLFHAFGLWMALSELGISHIFLNIWVEHVKTSFYVYLIASLIAGFLGVSLVRRTSPSFCPNCGNNLPPGNDPCPKCGTEV